MSSDTASEEYKVFSLHPDVVAMLDEIARKRCGGDEDQAVTEAIICFQKILEAIGGGDVKNKLAIVYPDGSIRELKLVP